MVVYDNKFYQCVVYYLSVLTSDCITWKFLNSFVAIVRSSSLSLVITIFMYIEERELVNLYKKLFLEVLAALGRIIIETS